MLLARVMRPAPGPAIVVDDDVCPLKACLVGKVVLEHLPGAGPGQVVHHHLGSPNGTLSAACQRDCCCAAVLKQDIASTLSAECFKVRALQSGLPQSPAALEAVQRSCPSMGAGLALQGPCQPPSHLYGSWRCSLPASVRTCRPLDTPGVPGGGLRSVPGGNLPLPLRPQRQQAGIDPGCAAWHARLHHAPCACPPAATGTPAHTSCLLPRLCGWQALPRLCSWHRWKACKLALRTCP